MGISPLLLCISLRLPTDSEPDETHRQHAYQSYGSIHTGKLRKELTKRGVKDPPILLQTIPAHNIPVCSINS